MRGWKAWVKNWARLELRGEVWQDSSIMMIGAFDIQEPLPELNDPHVFAMIRPWVDVGSVGSLTLQRLERYLGSKELGRLKRPGEFFDFTRYRPSMRLVDNERRVRIPNSIIRYATTDSGRDYLFLHLREPHANSETYTESILEVVERFGVKRYCRLGAMYDTVPHTRPLLVTGSLGGVEQIRPVPNLKLRRSTYQGPTTIMNLVSDGIDRMGIESINFMVHLPQYVQLDEDFNGTARMIEALASVYPEIPADLAPVRRGQRQYRELNAAVERNSDLQGLIKQMEDYYDSNEAEGGTAAEASGEDTGEEVALSPEIEQFLSELGEGFEEPER